VTNGTIPVIEAEVSGLERIEVIVVDEGISDAEVELVPAERELVFTINGTLEARFCCTPHRVRALVAGWLAGEGIIQSPEDVISLEYDLKDGTVDIRVSDKCFGRVMDRVPVGPLPVLGEPPFDRRADANLELKPDEVAALAEKFRKLFLSLKSAERMCYLCAVASPGEILSYGEGFHRINAMFRAMGEPVLNGLSLEGKIALMNFGPTRAMVSKLARTGVAMAICFAPPTSAAVEMGNAYFLTIIQAGTGSSIRVYSSPWRVV
jgi:FdhD protein